MDWSQPESMLNRSEPGLGSGLWIVCGAYFVVMLLLVIRSFLSKSSFSSSSSSSASLSEDASSVNEAWGGRSAKTMLTYILPGSIVDGRLILTCALATTLIGAFMVANISTDVYHNGFAALGWIPAILFAILGYQLFAPRLIKLSSIRQYASPIDFLSDRFRSRVLRAIVSIVMIIPTIAFMALMLKAAGSLLHVMSGDRIPELWGAVAIASMVLCFEFLGGLSSIGLVDILHGFLFLLSFMLIFVMESSLFGGFAAVVRNINMTTSSSIVETPNHVGHFHWVLWSIPFIAYPLYPHMLPRLQSVKSARSFRFALVALTLIPFMAVPAMIAFAMSGRSIFPHLLPAMTVGSGQTVTDLFALTIRLVMQQGSGYYLIGTVIFIASMSVVMSAISNGLLGTNTIVSLDMYLPLVGSSSLPSADRIMSLITSAALVGFAVLLSSIRLLTPSAWLGLTNGIILQLMPAFLIGLYSRSAKSLPIIIGLLSGLIISIVSHLALALSESAAPADIGSWFGLITNVALFYMVSAFFDNSGDISNDDHAVPNDPVELELSTFSFHLSREATGEEPIQHKEALGKFRSAMPSGLIGWRLQPGFDFDIGIGIGRIPDLSVSEISDFSGTFAVDHATVGATTLGSLGRIGDGNTEPIHNPVLLGAATIFLILSSPFYFSSPITEVPNNGLPFWTYLSVMSAMMSSAVLVYVMFSSWDIASSNAPSPQASFIDPEQSITIQGGDHLFSVPPIRSYGSDRFGNQYDEGHSSSIMRAATTAPPSAITRYSVPMRSGATSATATPLPSMQKPYGRQSRLFFHDPHDQVSQPESVKTTPRPGYLGHRRRDSADVNVDFSRAKESQGRHQRDRLDRPDNARSRTYDLESRRPRPLNIDSGRQPNHDVDIRRSALPNADTNQYPSYDLDIERGRCDVAGDEHTSSQQDHQQRSVANKSKMKPWKPRHHRDKVSIRSMDSELGSFSLEQEVRHYPYQ